jgi:serine/threonine protein phosphatase PrpC
MIKDDEIVSSFTLIDPEKIAENLLVKALEAGGKDNITITVIKFEENLEVHRNDSDVIPFLNRILKK